MLEKYRKTIKSRYTNKYVINTQRLPNLSYNLYDGEK